MVVIFKRESKLKVKPMHSEYFMQFKNQIKTVPATSFLQGHAYIIRNTESDTHSTLFS